MIWQTSRFEIDLTFPRIMGIVNVTPDSFSDGARHADPHSALCHCEQLLKEGADLLDVGGESTRPGSVPVSLIEERERVLPVLREAVKLGVPVSLDTCKGDLMRAALDLGVDIINDVWALRQPGAAEAVAAHPTCGVVLMHMHGEPQTMQTQPMADHDVPGQVLDWLKWRLVAVTRLGITSGRIALDPGIGFGKTIAQNYALLARQQELAALGCPILAAWSRKSSLGAVTGLGPHERLVPSVVAALLAIERGARILRVHDVAATRAGLAVWGAMQAVAPTLQS